MMSFNHIIKLGYIFDFGWMNDVSEDLIVKLLWICTLVVPTGMTYLNVEYIMNV